MIDVKQAISSAKRSLIDLFGENIGATLRLEEVELANDDRLWHVTLSFADPDRPMGAVAAALGSDHGRIYKTLQVDGETGYVRSVKIRVLR